MRLDARRLLRFEPLEPRQLLAASALAGGETAVGVGFDESSAQPQQATLVVAAAPPLETLPLRQAEALDRGVVALRRSTSQMYVGWRMLGTDPSDIAFNLYRSANGGAAVKLNGSPLTQTTDFVDSTANMTVANSYFVRPVVAGVELAASESFTIAAFAPTRQFLNLPLQIPAGGTTPSGEAYTYNANDASVGDLDGDGQYEVVLKWDPSNSKDNSQSGYTGNTYIDAYHLDGTFLWRIDLGQNIRAGAHYTQFTVYDLDGDGKAEVVMRTAPGTKDGQGNFVLLGSDSPATDYRNSSGYNITSPEYLTVFDGLTGANRVTVPYLPNRGSVSSWGDNYGNRVDRLLMAVAYLDGVHPSLVLGRGIFGPQSGLTARNELTAWDFNGTDLSLRWWFKAGPTINPTYVGQGVYNMVPADLDGDGKDEIVYGAMAINDDGTPLYSTGYGHGDAVHVGDLNLLNAGLEVFMPQETTSLKDHRASVLRDGDSGTLIAGPFVTAADIAAGTYPDVGRGVALDIDPTSPGYEFWESYSPGVYAADGTQLYAKASNMHVNFGVYWDADLQSETLDGTTISDWNYTTHGRSNLVSFGNSGINSTSLLSSNNGTKSTPSLVADLFGDWREEVIWRTTDNTALQIWSTTIASTTRFYTLMHDIQYRESVAWQNVGYNQPPHTSYFLGSGTAPAANLSLAGAPTLEGDFDWSGSVGGEDLAIWNQTYGRTATQGVLPGDADADLTVTGADFLAWQRNYGNGAAVAAATVAAAPLDTAATFDSALAWLAAAAPTTTVRVSSANNGWGDGTTSGATLSHVNYDAALADGVPQFRASSRAPESSSLPETHFRRSRFSRGDAGLNGDHAISASRRDAGTVLASLRDAN